MKITQPLLHELKHHLPFTISATVIAIILVLVLEAISINISKPAFESLHLIHLLASAAITAAIFYKYKKNILSAILIGILGAIVIGSISDIIFPFLGAYIFNFSPEFHLPLLEIPLLVLLVSGIGSLIGIITLSTKVPHTIHVGISVFASLFYLLAYVNEITLLFVLLSIIVVTISVIIPCCISDILLPFFFLGKKIKQCGCGGKCQN